MRCLALLVCRSARVRNQENNRSLQRQSGDVRKQALGAYSAARCPHYPPNIREERLIMAIIVRIPTTLRKITGGAARLDAQGATVREALNSIVTLHPELGERVYDEDGHLRRFVNLFVGGEDIRFLNGLETPLTEGAELSIVPAVAGG